MYIKQTYIAAEIDAVAYFQIPQCAGSSQHFSNSVRNKTNGQIYFKIDQFVEFQVGLPSFVNIKLQVFI